MVKCCLTGEGSEERMSTSDFHTPIHSGEYLSLHISQIPKEYTKKQAQMMSDMEKLLFTTSNL